jgi:hypothetical protein
MEKAIERFIQGRKDWDYALVLITGKSPMLVEADTDIKMVNDTIRLQTESGHPNPMVPSDAQKAFFLESYIVASAIVAIDFFREKKIVTGKNMLN